MKPPTVASSTATFKDSVEVEAGVVVAESASAAEPSAYPPGSAIAPPSTSIADKLPRTALTSPTSVASSGKARTTGKTLFIRD
jgi:hypothetical protein